MFKKKYPMFVQTVAKKWKNFYTSKNQQIIKIKKGTEDQFLLLVKKYYNLEIADTYQRTYYIIGLFPV